MKSSKGKEFPGESKLKFWCLLDCIMDFPGVSDSKASAYNEGDLGSSPGSGRSPGEDNGL